MKVLATASVALALCACRWGQVPEQADSTSTEEARTVVRVVDGDTLELDGDEHVRLIGVDTPEMRDSRSEVRELAHRAAAFTRRLCEGRTVKLRFERPRKDRYGRTLAYVYLDDGTFVNAEIVRQGYGHAYIQYPFRFSKSFLELEREARKAGVGLWQPKRNP